MFQVRHDHHGEFKRYFSAGRNSMSALVDNKKAEEFRRHVFAVTMTDENPPALAPAPTSAKKNRHSAAEPGRPGPRKLTKRRASTHATILPLVKKDETQLKGQVKTEQIETTEASINMRGPTITVQPIHPASFGSVTELHTLKEESIESFFAISNSNSDSPAAQEQERAQHHQQQQTRRPTLPRISHPTHTHVLNSAVELPGNDAAVVAVGSNSNGTSPDSMPPPVSKPVPVSVPMTLNRPRKLSNSSMATTSTMYSRDSSFASGMRSPSWGSHTSIESLDSTTQWRPEYLTQRPLPIKKQQPTAVRAKKPNELFSTMPSEVLHLVLNNLKQLHLGQGSISCATCWMRDVSSVCLASRKWSIVARAALYGDVQLVGPDSAAHKKKYKLAQGSRALMLRRTLRANPQLAALVRSLKVPLPETPIKGPTSLKGAAELAEYDNLVASLVMACPNLEVLMGPTVAYDHSFNRIFHALSTRTQLREMNWTIRASPHQKQQRIPSSTSVLGLVMPGELLPFQEEAFLELHANWTSLTSLSIHCLPGATLTPESLLPTTLSCLPSLQHLHLCNLPPNSFNDANLLALPPLETLGLSHITGITSNGLSAFATRSSSSSLRKLHLRHTPLTSLAALARMLSHLSSLTTLSIVQAFPPVMPEDDAFSLWMMPYLASNTIRKLHWDMTSHKSCISAADNILAKSIAAGGFPALRILRALNDPDGIFQDLCYPVERIDMPTDRFRLPEAAAAPPEVPASPLSPLSPTRYLFKTSSSNSSLNSPRTNQSPSPPPPADTPANCTSLHTARLAAQSRLESAQSKPPRWTVNVIDEDHSLVETFKMGAFIGTAGSKIKYHLHPDIGATDEKGGLVDVRDLATDCGESLSGGREGCTGRWNQREGVVADRKEKERWWHTERGRWTKLALH